MALGLSALLVVASLGAGCAIKRRLPIDVLPVQTDRLRAALARSRECSDPAPAKPIVGRDFRYGCFCGPGWPEAKPPFDKPPEQLTQDQREELIEKVYYERKPIDDIDLACRNHDVCWIMHGEGNVDCDQALIASLKDIRDRLFSRRRSATEYVYSLDQRCVMLTLDMRLAFLTIFTPAPAERRSSDIGWTIGKSIGTMMLLGTVALFEAITLKSPGRYPLPGERCRVTSPP